jgi:hypothetical protein
MTTLTHTLVVNVADKVIADILGDGPSDGDYFLRLSHLKDVKLWAFDPSLFYPSPKAIQTEPKHPAISALSTGSSWSQITVSFTPGKHYIGFKRTADQKTIEKPSRISLGQIYSIDEDWNVTVEDPEDPETVVSPKGEKGFGFSNENFAIPVYIRGHDDDESEDPPDLGDERIHIHQFTTWLPGNGMIVIPELELEPQRTSIAVWFENHTEDEGFLTYDQSRKFHVRFLPGQKRREIWYLETGVWDEKDPGAVNGNLGPKQLANRQKKK